MTREEAIWVLKSTPVNLGRRGGKTAYVEALQMAIEALKAQDVTDTNDGDIVYRQAAIGALDKHLQMTDVPVSYPGIISALTEWLNELPPAQPELIEKAAYIRGFEQGRTQGMIASQGGKK